PHNIPSIPPTHSPCSLGFSPQQPLLAPPASPAPATPCSSQLLLESTTAGPKALPVLLPLPAPSPPPRPSRLSHPFHYFPNLQNPRLPDPDPHGHAPSLSC
ncbi:unnamed protein product, partial [Closterium sp. NIES-54]